MATLTAGQPTLLRFLNAGLQTHVPVINGMSMRLIAEDGNPYPWPTNPREQYSVMLPAAKTIDAIIVPQAVAGEVTTRYPIYDRRMGLSNDGSAGRRHAGVSRRGRRWFCACIHLEPGHHSDAECGSTATRSPRAIPMAAC